MKRTIFKTTAIMIPLIFAILFGGEINSFAKEGNGGKFAGVYITVVYKGGGYPTSGTVRLCGPNGTYTGSIDSNGVALIYAPNGEYCVEAIAGSSEGTSSVTVTLASGSATVTIEDEGTRCSNCTGS